MHSKGWQLLFRLLALCSKNGVNIVSKRSVNKLSAALILLSILAGNGCVSEQRKIETAQFAMQKTAKAIQNPDTVYIIPASGIYVPAVLDISVEPPELIGPIWIRPGTSLIFDEETLNEISFGIGK